MSESKHQFSITGGAKDSASKRDTAFTKKLDALFNAGGDEVHNWFSAGQSSLHALNQSISMGGPSVWIKGTDETTGNPVWYVVEGDSMLVIGAYYTEDGIQAVKDGTLSLDESEEIGFAYMLLMLQVGQQDESTHQIGVYSLEYAGDGIPEIEVGEGMRTFIEQLAKVVKEFVGEMIVMAFEVEGTVGASAVQQQIADNAGKAADSTKVEGEVVNIADKEVTADFVISASEGIGLVFGLGELALSLALILMAKKIVTYARIYNCSDTPFELTVCYVSAGAALVSGPMLAQTPMNIPALGATWTPADLIGDKPAHYIDLIFCNTDDMKGVDYVLKAAAYDDFPGFNVLVNVPFKDDGSVYASFDVSDQCVAYFNKFNGQKKSLSTTTESDKYILKIASNQLSGKSPSPTDGDLGYYFEHIIVFENA